MPRRPRSSGTLGALGVHAVARELHEQTLAAMRRLLGDEHPDTLGSMEDLAQTVRALGDHAGACDLPEYPCAPMTHRLSVALVIVSVGMLGCGGSSAGGGSSSGEHDGGSLSRAGTSTSGGASSTTSTADTSSGASADAQTSQRSGPTVDVGYATFVLPGGWHRAPVAATVPGAVVQSDLFVPAHPPDRRLSSPHDPLPNAMIQMGPSKGTSPTKMREVYKNAHIPTDLNLPVDGAPALGVRLDQKDGTTAVYQLSAFHGSIGILINLEWKLGATGAGDGLSVLQQLRSSWRWKDR